MLGEELGYKVFTVPEAATIAFSNGAEWETIADSGRYNLIKRIMQMQLSLEDSFTSIAQHSNCKAIVLCDRGLLDNEAYFPRQLFWEMVMHDQQWNIPYLREARYDAVVHLRTAAIGAEKFYTTANNTARRETPEEAALLDHKILDAYIGHPRLSVIDNRSDESFDYKMKRVLNVIFGMIGESVPLGEEFPLGVERKRFAIQRGNTSTVSQARQHLSYSDDFARKVKIYIHDLTFNDMFQMPHGIRYVRD